jgi:hypothetical protein
MLAFDTFLILISLCKHLWLLKLRIVRRACAKCCWRLGCKCDCQNWKLLCTVYHAYKKLKKNALALIRHSYHFHSIGIWWQVPLMFFGIFKSPMFFSIVQVILFGHSPPGVFEAESRGLPRYWYHSAFNTRYQSSSITRYHSPFKPGTNQHSVPLTGTIQHSNQVPISRCKSAIIYRYHSAFNTRYQSAFNTWYHSALKPGTIQHSIPDTNQHSIPGTIQH